MSLRDLVKFHVSDEQVKRFQEDGVICIKGALSSREVEDLRDDVGSQISKLHETHTAYDFDSIARQVWGDEEDYDVGEADRFDMENLKLLVQHDKDARPLRDAVPQGEDKGQFFYDAAGWRFYDGIRAAALDSALPEICAQILDSSYINFWEDTTFVKTPGTAQRTAFHQDFSYFHINGDKCCIVWIALDSVTSENGGMEYIRGSHRWDEKYAPNILIGQSVDPNSQFPKCPDIESDPDAYDIISFDVEPGDVIIHHALCIHGSSGNRTKDKSRRAISFRYCGDDIRYFDRPGAAPQPHLLDKPKDGDPLYSLDYPLVWPRPFPGARLSQIFDGMRLTPAAHA